MPKRLVIPVLLTVLVGYGPLSTDLYLPALPAIRDALGATTAQTQLSLSLFLAAFAVANLAYGPLSDRFGRKPLLLGGLVVFVAASAACALALSIGQLLLARVAQALGACAGPVLARAMARDLRSPQDAARLLSYMGTAMAVLPILGPLLGGWLTQALGWRANFAALLLIGLATLAAAAALLPETNRKRDPRSLAVKRLLAKYRRLLASRVYRGYVLAVAGAYSAIFAFISGSSFLFVDYLGLAPAAYGACFATAVLGYVAGTLASGRLTRRLGMERLARIGGWLSAGAGLAMLAGALSPLLAPGPVGVAVALAPMVGVLAGAGLVMPNAQAAALGPFPGFAGSAASLMGFAQMLLAAGLGAGVGAAIAATPAAVAVGVAVSTAGSLAAILGIAQRGGVSPETGRGAETPESGRSPARSA